MDFLRFYSDKCLRVSISKDIRIGNKSYSMIFESILQSVRRISRFILEINLKAKFISFIFHYLNREYSIKKLLQINNKKV